MYIRGFERRLHLEYSQNVIRVTLKDVNDGVRMFVKGHDYLFESSVYYRDLMMDGFPASQVKMRQIYLK